MDFYDVIKNRRSVREYDPEKEIPDDVLKRILEAGRIAPSAGNRQPWKFLVVKSEEIREKVCQSYGRGWVRNAPVMLVAVGYRDRAWIRPKDGHNSIEVDLTIAMDHMILAAAAEGLGTCWIIAYDYDLLKSALNLKEDEFVSCITPLGYPPDTYEKREMPERKSFDQVVEVI